MTALFRRNDAPSNSTRSVEGGRPRRTPTAATAELLELVGALRSVPEPQARPEFVADLRERLMLAAETELSAAPAARSATTSPASRSRPRRTRRERRVGLALGAVAIIGATTSMAVASQSALPGDALYPLKRAIENTQTGFSVGDDAKGETILGNASGRLDEVDELAQRGRARRRARSRRPSTPSPTRPTEAGDQLHQRLRGTTATRRRSSELQQFTHDSVGTLAASSRGVPARPTTR